MSSKELREASYDGIICNLSTEEANTGGSKA